MKKFGLGGPLARAVLRCSASMAASSAREAAPTAVGQPNPATDHPPAVLRAKKKKKKEVDLVPQGQPRRFHADPPRPTD